MLDVDGVVVNGRPQDGRSWATDIERDLGIAPDRLQSDFFAPHWNDIVTGRKKLLEVLELCLPKLSDTLTAPAFLEYWFARDSAADIDVLAACDELRGRGVRVFLATNQEAMRASYLMERLGLRKHVDGMIYSAQVSARKPEQGFFEAATQHCGMAPDDILLVDDTEANIESAIRAGWSARLWTRDLHLVELVESS